MVSVQRHVALLRSALRAEETERAWIRAEHRPEGYSGALLLTDRRLLFSGLGFVQQLQTGWPLRTFDGVRLDGDTLTATFGGVAERFHGKPKDLARLAALLGDAPAPAVRTDIDELERLAALHIAGSLTDQEFAAAKRRLLGS